MLWETIKQRTAGFCLPFAFPRSHAELLPVRESKKERSAYEAAQAKEEGDGGESAGFSLVCCSMTPTMSHG